MLHKPLALFLTREAANAYFAFSNYTIGGREINPAERREHSIPQVVILRNLQDLVGKRDSTTVIFKADAWQRFKVPSQGWQDDMPQNPVS